MNMGKLNARRSVKMDQNVKRVIIIMALLLFFSTGASRARSETMDDKFDSLAKRFVDESPSLSPVGATALGDHRFDDQLDEVSVAARDRERTFYNSLLGDLDRIDRRYKLQ